MNKTDVTSNRIFGAFLLLSELILFLVYGFTETYSPSASLKISDDYYIIASLIMLALLGFGFIAGYIKSASTSTFTHLIIILALSMQYYFAWRGFWEIIGLSGAKADNSYNILPISVVNAQNDRIVAQKLASSAFSDYIACLISLVIGYSSLVGRLGNLGVFFLTVIGTFMYQFNSMIFWRIFVTDCGFGMRIFLFGGALSLISSLMLRDQSLTVESPLFKSDYFFQGLNLFGSIVIWCLLPVLNWSDLWHTFTIGTDSYILHVVSFNMWIALCGSVLGSYSAYIVLYGKLSIHALVFSLFTGGIAYTSISDLNLNPGVAMAIGTISSFFCAFLQEIIKIKMNKSGIKDSTGVVSAYLIPGFFAGILSAIFQADGAKSYGTYKANFDPARDRFNQGGIQIAGLAIALLLGSLAGLAIGAISNCVNLRSKEHELESRTIVGEVDIQKQKSDTSGN